MDTKEHIISTLYQRVLQRSPGPEELAYWMDRCASLTDVPGVIEAFFECEEYQRKNFRLGHPPGHFYSPINDPFALVRDEPQMRIDRAEKRTIPGVELDFERMRSVWNDICSAPDIKDIRYTADNGAYGSGDALLLSGMINRHRPKRIIEIGSGFSSARMLDTIDTLKLDTQVTFIEPYPNTLMILLREQDKKRYEIIEREVQRCDLALFDQLDRNDILFIDSSHVMKARSDVNFELFEILPRLKPGVVIHFHDMFWPFEYPADWLFGVRYSWNELYGVRAFLQYNDAFRVEFFGDAFSLFCKDAIAQAPERPKRQFLANTGGALWLTKL